MPDLSFDDLIPPQTGAPNIGGEVSFDDLIPRGDGILEGVTDPQQYAEFAKGIVPGAIGMVAGTVPKGAAIFDPVEAIQANMQRYIEQMRRVPQMTLDELATFRMEVEKEPAPATRIAVQSAISDLLDGSARMEDVEARFARPTPMAKRPLYRAGVAGEQFAKDLIPAARGYEQAVGRQLGEGLGTMAAGLPVAMVGGGIPAGIFFGVSGAGEAVARAVKFDETEKKAGRPGLTEEQILLSGLMGIGPGATDILPIETLLGNLKIPTPFRRPLAQAIGRIGGQAAIEGFQEGGQAFLQNLIEREIYNEKRGLAEGVQGDAGVGAGVGAIAQTGKELLGLLLPGRRRGAGQPAGEAKPPAAEPEVLPPEPPPADAPSAAPEAPQPALPAVTMSEEAALALQELDAMLAQQAAEPDGIAQADTVAPEVRARARQILQDDIEGLTAADADAAIEQASAPPTKAPVSISPPSLVEENIDIAPIPAAAPANTALPVEDFTPAPSDEAAAVEEAAAQTAEPTEGQKVAGNYRKGSVNFQGLDIKIETPRGAERTGIDKDGKPWAVALPDHYGYVRRTEGKDGDQVDVYIGPKPESDRVFVIDQRHADTKKWDEHKAMLGYASEGEALNAYEKAFSDGRGMERVAAITPMSVEQFKAWLKNGNTKREVAKQNVPEAPADLIAAGRGAFAAGQPRRAPAEIKDKLAWYRGYDGAKKEQAKVSVEQPEPKIERPQPKAALYTISDGKKNPPRIAAKLTGEEMGKPTSIGHLRSLVGKYAREKLIGRTVTNKETGFPIQINSSGIRHSTFGKGDEILKLLPAVPQMLEHGQYLGEQSDKHDRKDIRAVHRFASAADLGGKEIKTILIVREHKNGKMFYDIGRASDALISGTEKLSPQVRGTGFKHNAPPEGDIAPAEREVKGGATATERVQSEAEGPKPQVRDQNTPRTADNIEAATPDEKSVKKDSKDNGLVSLLDTKNADALRARAAAAKVQRAARLSAKGVREEVETEPGKGGDSGDLFDLNRDLTPRAQEKRDLLEKRLTAMVRHIAGENAQVVFPDKIPLGKEMAQGWGSYKDKFRTAAGSYIPADRLIKIALADPKYRNQTSTAVHEAFHAVEHLLLTDKEMAVLKAAEPQLRKVAQDHADLTDKQARELADYEVRAIAFQAYADARMNGRPIAGLSGAVRRVFEKLRQMLQRMRSALNGMGFRTAEDVFSDVYEGKMAGRAAKERPIGEVVPASLNDGKPTASDLARFIRGEITAEQFVPGDARWAKIEAFIAKTFKEKQRAAMADAVATGSLDALPTMEKSITERLLGHVGGKPPTPPRPPARTGGSGDGNAQRRILDRIVPSDKAKKKLPTLNQVYTATKDDLNPLRIIRNELTEGKDIPIEQDPYRLARLVRGAVGKAQQMIQNGTFAFKDLHDNGKSLTQILAPVEKDLDGFRAYMAARRAAELAGRGIKTGIDVDDARSVVRDGLEKFAKPFEELVAYQRRVLDYLRDSGIVAPEAYAAMVEANKDYVPFFRYMEGDAEGMGTSGRNLRVKDPVKGIKGSTREIIDPIESIIKNTFLYVALAEKNRALTALDDLAASSPKGEKFLRKPDDKAPARAEGEGDVDAMAAFKPDGFSPAKDRIAFYRNGKREVREVDPELAAAVNAMDRETFGWLLKILATPARLLRAGATLAPEFIVRNPVRDQFTAFIFSENGFVPVWDTLRGVGGIFRRDADFQAWLKAGGANATLVSLDRKYIDEQVFRLSDPSFLKRFNNVVTSPVTFLRMLSEVMENATRIGEFKRARGKGKSDFDAAFGSREVTLDFARKGAQMKAVNSLVAFFNASLEGTDREIRGFAKRPLASTIKVMAAITLPSILLWFANHDDDRYKELPQWEKDIFWHVLTKDTIWRIPKPFALGVLFGSVPERALEAFVAKRPKAFKELGESIVQSFVPGLIPEFMKPTIEQFANRSTFTGRNIVPKYLENVLPQDQATHFTSDIAKLIGKAMSKLGLDQSSFSSPLVIDNYIRAWSGGLGTHVVKLADKSLRASGVTPSPVEPTSTLADMPVIKAFVSRYPSASAKSIQDFYDTYEERRRAVGSVKLHARAGDTKKSEEIRREYAIENAERIHRALGQQHKFIRDIHANKSMSPDEKRRIIDATYMQMIEFSKAGNAMFLSTEERRKAANQ